ncbi:UDP-N-acetylmuramoyl-L-alanyl-D-glutamate--2,6-diaminopimelate ligase [Asticcacaulis sp. AC402]|uniref:UDP-N-acetylmuramoyl-L-alanyl-D-glutamate--2, 6-diaminopimelate ligase n=1 Tax=Asticcacaulis sp. AC402 TaxID=1282361 RepID=UPI0003C3F2C5|nr:UDP-N-acetylmuramoyl-L-alanyl-D-glutamate--2,6-diaminopimelate ligase [Asticcacaulis sp. AC402]ESQ76031.1 UDP-N-acetylmuramoylalanyl-D-glutamate--2,6-diaminopimelate ligase [Asticcacaulis sp. AC402]
MSTVRLSEILRRDLDHDPLVTGVTADSRKVDKGTLFCALPGTAIDGRDFIPQALAKGAAAVLAPDDTAAFDSAESPLVKVADVRRAYALAAKAFYGSQPKTCVAVTGTNGKTSVATFCRQIFATLGHKSASMGTLGVVKSDLDGTETAVTGPGLTTPDAADMARHLCELAADGVSHLALEASSHGIDQRRLDGVSLTAAGFTNLTQDHLDYHATMDAYRTAKLRLFESLLPRGRTAVLNADSDAYNSFAAMCVLSGVGVLSVGERGRGLAMVGRDLTVDGQILFIEHQGKSYETKLPLAGLFQASNALVAAGLCIAAGEDAPAVIHALSKLKGARGRLERVGAKRNAGEVYVDYAHTPDGLETVLKALRPHTQGKLVVVFGCGGDRDKGKRPQMGAIADKLADRAIVTDDNPRSEAPATIRAEVLAGMSSFGLKEGAIEIGDRKKAIFEAVSGLKTGDVLVVAGKGHEQGQIVGDKVLPFDDVAVVQQALNL